MGREDTRFTLQGLLQPERTLRPERKPVRTSHRPAAESPTVWTDLSSSTPVRVTELEAIEAYIGALIDDLLR